MSLIAYHDYKLWLRIFDKRILTEDGAYCEANLPIEYAGSELELEFNQIMVFGTSTGTFVEFRVTDYLDLKDKDDATGIGYTYDLYGQTFNVDPIAPEEGDPSTVIVDWYTKFYGENFPETGDGKMRYMHQQSMLQQELVPEDTEFTDE
jgi:hypothetical protein